METGNKGRLIIIEGLVDILMERGKHGAVLHVVSVDDGIET